MYTPRLSQVTAYTNEGDHGPHASASDEKAIPKNRMCLRRPLRTTAVPVLGTRPQLSVTFRRLPFRGHILVPKMSTRFWKKATMFLKIFFVVGVYRNCAWYVDVCTNGQWSGPAEHPRVKDMGAGNINAGGPICSARGRQGGSSWAPNVF